MGTFPRFIHSLVIASGCCIASLSFFCLFSSTALAAGTGEASEGLLVLRASSTLNPHGQGTPPSGMGPVGSPCCTQGAGSR